MFLCGADVLQSMLNYKVWREEDVEFILANHGVAVVEREGTGPSLSKLIFENDVFYKNRVRLFLFTKNSKTNVFFFQHNIYVIPSQVQNDVSSTRVRQLCKRGHSIKYLVTDDSVISFIVKHDLYKLQSKY